MRSVPVVIFIVFAALLHILYANKILSHSSSYINIPTQSDQELIDFLGTGTYKRCRGTPAEFSSDQICKASIDLDKMRLSGKVVAEPDQIALYRDKLSSLRRDIEIGLKWPHRDHMTVDIPFTQTPPLIDGKIDEREWNAALSFQDQLLLNTDKPLGKADGAWRVLWDKEYLYFSAKFADDNIISYPYGDGAKKLPWDGDCFEVFVLPEMRYKTYWEVVVNPNGDLFDGLHMNSRFGGFIGGPEEVMSGLKRAASISDGGYTIEIAVPFKELPSYSRGNPPQRGEQLFFMMIRCDNGKRISPIPFLYDGHNIFGYIRGRLHK